MGCSITKKEYNDEPVYYCSHCLSLKIMTAGENLCYCEHCSTTDIELTHIDKWEKMYERKYGHKYINK